MALTSFRLSLAGDGTGEIVVGGVDLSRQCRGLNLTAEVGRPPRLVVELLGQAEVDGLADVTLVRAGADDFAEFLEHIDHEELEREALARLSGFDDTSATRIMLDVLAEWAAGR